MLKIIKDCELKNNNQKKSNMQTHFWRFLIDFFLNTTTFVYIILLINKKVPFCSNHIKDIVYIILCLLNEIYFTINEESFKEMKRILTCKKIDKNTNNEDSENKTKLVTKTETEIEENEDNEN